VVELELVGGAGQQVDDVDELVARGLGGQAVEPLAPAVAAL
jgi:hypothetical protein